MTKPKRPLKVFLCHAHADRDVVRGLYARLIKDGMDVWLDKAKLVGGQNFENEINRAVRESDVVVVCLSKEFKRAGFRQKEVKWALDAAMKQPEGEIFIIPLRLEECETLESLRELHWVDLFEENGYGMLLNTLRMRAGRIDVMIPPSRSSMQPVQKKIASRTEDNSTGTSKPSLRKTVNLAIVVISVVASLITIAIFLSGKPYLFDFFPKNTATSTAALTYQPTSLPETISTEVLPLTATPIVFNPYPESSDYVDSFGVPMRLVPAGEFTMGATFSGLDEQPVHQVYLDSYFIDKYEVTNTLYRMCVEAGVCTSPHFTNSYSRSAYYGNLEFDNFPIIYVDWNQAGAYCGWRGGNLPTEAQWEKAARGTDERTYPWGEGIDCQKANYCEGDTVKVGNYENGKSPYGVYDLAGNIWEWTADWYSDTYYQRSPSSNPKGPDSGEYRVLRGGTWYYKGDNTRVTIRGWYTTDSVDYYIGFRCARNENP